MIKVVPKKHHAETKGCVLCGSALVYSDKPQQATCFVCHQNFETLATCTNGHYICDNCHSADILTKVEQLLSSSGETDPVALINRVFDLPGLNMHGPEYHSIVPAVLVAAHQNKSGQRDRKAIKEAIRRGKDIKGGSCGYCGGCGSAIGTGVAAAVLSGASPMTNSERGNALKQSGEALLAVSQHGGPRCCKRDAVTSIKTFMRTSGYFDGVTPATYTCRQSKDNKGCIGTRCPYFG